jgi:hypothetical protein
MIPEILARILSRIPEALVFEIAHLIKSIIESDDPKAALARAIQVTAHEKAADAAVDALFAAKKSIPGTGV